MTVPLPSPIVGRLFLFTNTPLQCSWKEATSVHVDDLILVLFFWHVPTRAYVYIRVHQLRADTRDAPCTPRRAVLLVLYEVMALFIGGCTFSVKKVVMCTVFSGVKKGIEVLKPGTSEGQKKVVHLYGRMRLLTINNVSHRTGGAPVYYLVYF